jgi:competence protein ComEC
MGLYLPAKARLIFPALLGWVVGSGLQLQQAVLYSWQIYASLLLLALVLWLPLRLPSLSIRWRIALTGIIFGVLALGLTGLRASVFVADALDPGLEGRDVVVTGVVSAMPQRSEAGLRFRLAVEVAQLEGRPLRLPHRLYLSWYSNVVVGTDAGTAEEVTLQPLALVAGERWQMTVRLKAPHGASNPFGFDYELWLWEQGLQASGYVRTGARDPAPLLLGQTGWHPIERARQAVRERIFRDVAQGQFAGLIAALVVGDQNAIARADWEIFRATGVAHLMSISGLHITMFAWAASALLAWLWRRSNRLCLWLPAPSAALLGGVVLATAYALFSGWGVPSQRTILMLASVGLLRLSGKTWPWPQVWLLACAVVVAVDPWALMQAGFWLSFVAVGVLFASASGGAASGAVVSPDVPRFWKVKLAAGLAGLKSMLKEQWVITLALTPLTLLLFGQVSLVALVANALAIPWVTLVVTPLAMAGVLLPHAWELAALALAALSTYLQWLAALPFATLSVAQAPLWAGLAGVLGGVLLVLQLPLSVRLTGLPLLLPVLLWQAPRPLVGQFELLAADVGQGSAVIVRSATHALLYDAGPRFSRESDAGNRVLVPLLRALDLPVDVMVLSHRDSDHSGGAPALLAMQTRAILLSSIEDDQSLASTRSLAPCVAGQRWRWDGVDFEILHPQAQDYASQSRANAMSCVLRISNGAQTALLTGDIEEAQEAQLIAAQPLKLDVLLVPHHGSKSSSSAAFLDATQPRIALVQAGYRNRFGHPAQSVLVRYQERGIRVLDSPRCGAASWQSAHPQEVKCQRQQDMHYWQHRLP